MGAKCERVLPHVEMAAEANYTLEALRRIRFER